MNCPKGKKDYHDKPKMGRYYCKKCGSVSKKKRDFCKSKKIKKDEDLLHLEEILAKNNFSEAA